MEKKVTDSLYIMALAIMSAGLSGSVWWRFFILGSYESGLFSPKKTLYLDIVLGGVFGIIIGTILALIVKNFGSNLFKGILTGAIINGLFPIWLLYTLVQERGVEKITLGIWVASIGQIIVGGILGWLISKYAR